MASNRYAAKAFANQHSEATEHANVPAEKKRKWIPYNKGPKIEQGSLYVPQLNLSPAQLRIIDDVCSPDSGSVIVDAKAGTSKTTVCVEAMYRLPPELKVSYFIFAKRNQTEAFGKSPKGVNVQTCHSLGLKAIVSRFGKVNVDDKFAKSDKIAKALFGYDDDKAEVRYSFVQVMKLAKAYLCETVEDVLKVIDKHEPDLCDESAESFAAKVIKGLETCLLQPREVEYDDMIWLPIKLNLPLPQFDVVFSDECQDLSPARIQLILRTVKPKGRLVSVGDVRQAIFSFTGADAQALSTIKELSNAHVLPLNMTFRCGKNIVKLAQEIVPEYEAHESNPEGCVAEMSEQDMLQGAQPGDAILSRVNAPLVSYALQLLKAGKRCNILGRDIGKGLLFMIRRSQATNVDEFLTWLGQWANIECERRVKKNQDCEQIKDKAACLESFCEGTNDLALVKERITEMFSDTEEGSFIILSSIHRFKGMERKTVWVLASTLKRGKSVEEDNIAYVSYTRAKENLFLVKAKA